MIPLYAPEWWPAHLEVKDESVEIRDLETPLIAFVTEAARMHFNLSGKPLVVTSGNDSEHGAGSMHYQNKAVDLRSTDLLASDADIFARLMVPLQSQCKVGIFDERFIGQSHWHVECA